MDLLDVLSTIWRTKWIILATAIVAAGIIFYRSSTQETIYQAEALLAVGNFGGARLGGEDKIAASYAELAQTRDVLQRSVEIGKLDKKPWELRGGISTVTSKDSTYIKLKVSDTRNAETAVNSANAVAAGLINFVDELKKNNSLKNQQLLIDELAVIEKDIAETRANPVKDTAKLSALEDARSSLLTRYEEKSTGYNEVGKLTLIQKAEFATASASRPLRNTAIGFVVGLIAGVGIGFATESVRKAIKQKQ